MKKLNILAILASVTIAFSGLTGCLAGDPDLAPATAPGYIIGNVTLNDKSDGAIDLWNTKAVPLTYGADGASYTFEYTKDMQKFWGTTDKGIAFKFLDGVTATGASTTYGADALSVNTKASEGFTFDKSSDGNVLAEAFTVGESYTITIKPAGTPIVTISGKAGSGSSSSDSDEEEEVVLPTYIIGDPAVGASGAITSWWSASAAKLSAYTKDIATFTFTCDGNAGEWSGDATKSAFKLIVPKEDLSDVDTNWGKTDIAVDAGWAIQGVYDDVAARGDNMIISGLESGKTYKISVYANGKTILVRCDTVE